MTSKTFDGLHPAILAGMAKALFYWDKGAKRYRNQRGQFISQERAEELRRDLIADEYEANRRLAERLLSGEITPQRFEDEMRFSILRFHTTQYVIGRGGIKQMGPRDYGILGAMVKPQYNTYLRNRLMRDLANGRYTTDAVGALAVRMQMYTSASNAAYERGRAESWEVTLPHLPGDGSTECLTNCQCKVRYKLVNGKVHVYWDLGEAEHCDDCKRRANEWSPLVLEPRG